MATRTLRIDEPATAVEAPKSVAIYRGNKQISIKEFPDERIEWVRKFNEEYGGTGLRAELVA